MKKVTYFDVEWANSKNKSICQMGILCEDLETNKAIYPEVDYKINPEDDFDRRCENIHNMTPKMVANERTFPQVWNEVKKYFVDTIVVGYKVAGADLDALTKCLQRYNLDVPEFDYIDVDELAKKYFRDNPIEHYRLKTVCDYFNVEICREHDAFYDACACKELFLALKKMEYPFQIEIYTHKYVADNNFVFESYISDTHFNQAICEIYGVVQGIGMDNTLSSNEIAYIANWKKDNIAIVNYNSVASIFDVIDAILVDGVITKEELSTLRKTMERYFLTCSTAETTRASQILYGILKGISCDQTICETECSALQEWLYEYECLKEHYPYNEIVECLNVILQDNIITKSENEQLLDKIDEILNPIQRLKEQVDSVNGRKVCLTGEFRYGPKDEVKKYITERGGIICDSVTKKLDILIVGDNGSPFYSHGDHGHKVDKAIEYQKKYHADIRIVREDDFFSRIK